LKYQPVKKEIMKSAAYLLSLLFLFPASCNRIETDETGHSSFYLRNTTTENIYFNCCFHPEFSDNDSISGNITPNVDAPLLEEAGGIIGMHPRPEDVFTRIILYRDVLRTDTLCIQDPVADSLWEYEIQDEYAFWENTHYTLVVR
jgi:hypothetical protein